MRKFTLNIAFESTDLVTIYKAKQRIVLSKQNNSGSKLAWVTIDPFQYNTLEWTDDYAVYCSNAEISAGVKIRRLSDIDAQPGVQYIFKDGYFSVSPDSRMFLSEQSYYVQNEMSGFDSLIFGLAQGVAINGKQSSNNPINAITVPYMQNISFSPHEVVEIYLESAIDDSVVVDNSWNKPFTISFGQETGDVNVRYNSDKGMFLMM